MSSKAIAALEFDASTREKAQQDAFEFDLDAPGIIRVTNTAHDDEDPADHSYRVNVETEGENGTPVACECPAFEYQPRACKHMVAVAIRAPVLAAATVRNRGHATDHNHSPEPEAIADGGQLLADENDDENEDDDEDGQVDTNVDADLEAQFRVLFAKATDARACVFGNDHCQGPEGEVLPCFDCHMADALDHYPADSTAVADAPDLDSIVADD